MTADVLEPNRRWLGTVRVWDIISCRHGNNEIRVPYISGSAMEGIYARWHFISKYFKSFMYPGHFTGYSWKVPWLYSCDTIMTWSQHGGCRCLGANLAPGHQHPPCWPLQWRYNGRDSVSNHQHHDCLLNRLFRCRSKKTSKLRVTGLCAGNSPWPVNAPHKWPVTRKMFPFDDVIVSIVIIMSHE